MRSERRRHLILEDKDTNVFLVKAGGRHWPIEQHDFEPKKIHKRLNL